ncbi:MAG: DUF6580 family putative transport protein [Methanobacteriota archaeon]
MGVPDWLRFKRKDAVTSSLLVTIGVAVRLILLNFDAPNVEPVMALTIIASMVMPLALAVLVPIGIMAITDALIYAFNIHGQYGIGVIAGVTFFVWTGFMMAMLLGSWLRKRCAFKLKNLGVITFAGVLATLIFDVWTVVGIWYFMDGASMDTLQTRFQWQIGFTLVHVASSLIFIPLFGSGYILLTEHETEFSAQAPRDSPEGEARPGL